MDQPFSLNIVGRRKLWYVISTVLILPGIISLIVWHLNVGIDFKGGSSQQIDFPNGRPGIEEIRSELGGQGIKGLSVQTVGDKDIQVRFPDQGSVKPRDTGNLVLGAVRKRDGSSKEVGFASIGQSVARATIKSAVVAVVLTSLAIILFIAFSFRSVPRPASSWRFGMTAILALAHDILFTVGAFSLIGHFFPSVEVDSLFITALLFILGFSVNDTIVVFDRIRENLRRSPNLSFEEVANSSLNQTFARSVNTSTTVLLVLLALLIFGGQPIRSFILALTLGVAIGTYSSIFNATPLLVSWQLWANVRQPAKKR